MSPGSQKKDENEYMCYLILYIKAPSLLMSLNPAEIEAASKSK